MSNSDDHRNHRQPRLVGSQRALHSILGCGKVTELVLWKNKTSSAGVLAGFSAVWFLFEVLDYHLVTFLCHLLIILMLLLFFWNKLAIFANWNPPNVHDFEISESTFRYLFHRINWLLFNFFQVSSGHDLKLFAMVMGSLWLLSAIGELANSLNLMYIVFLSLQILPVVYDKYEERVDQVAAQVATQLKSYFHPFFHVLSKIPRRGPLKQKQ